MREETEGTKQRRRMRRRRMRTRRKRRTRTRMRRSERAVPLCLPVCRDDDDGLWFSNLVAKSSQETGGRIILLEY
jgi:hypothetical protein